MGEVTCKACSMSTGCLPPPASQLWGLKVSIVCSSLLVSAAHLLHLKLPVMLIWFDLVGLLMCQAFMCFARL